jgi:hypothetical protein
VLLEEIESALARQRGARRVVAAPLVAIEAMIGIVDIDRQIGVLGLEFLYAGQRDMRVLRAKVQDRRNARRFVFRGKHAAAVIAGRGR